MELFIRAAEVEDFESITRLSYQFGYIADTKKTKERLSEIIVSNDNCAFVATDSGIVIGWIHGFYTLRIQSDPFVEIGGLVVDENYRRKGIGRLLVQKVTEWAKLKNGSTIRVKCNSIRKESHQFYISIGFKEVKEQKVFYQSLKYNNYR
ncbi:GNAT family N-acetyltransferase [Ferruginibacter sp.]|nr:GNAT family N-acetyltransferase [Ferruginibacter sp.]